MWRIQMANVAHSSGQCGSLKLLSIEHSSLSYLTKSKRDDMWICDTFHSTMWKKLLFYMLIIFSCDRKFWIFHVRFFSGYTLFCCSKN